MNEPYSVVTIFQIGGTIVSLFALIIAMWAFRRTGIHEQFKMGDSFSKDMQNLVSELKDISSNDKIKLANFDSRLFNTLEWYCFLINEGKIKYHRLIRYFASTIIDWHDRVFRVTATEENKTNPKHYPAFK